jgi:Tfp pilus assembly protein PilX
MSSNTKKSVGRSSERNSGRTTGKNGEMNTSSRSTSSRSRGEYDAKASGSSSSSNRAFRYALQGDIEELEAVLSSGTDSWLNALDAEVSCKLTGALVNIFAI